MMEKNENEYKKSGVDVEKGYETIKLIKPLIEETKINGVLGSIGGFSGLFEPNFENYKNPVLVSSTDGVGTKIKVAEKLKKHTTIGIDLVAMCVNDIICNAASPLFFLDYIACGENTPEKIKDIVFGIKTGCIESKMALIGGETAEHPNVMKKEEYDLAGFCVGIVEKEKILPKNNIKEKDILIGIESSGLHSNGFSLVRKIFDLEKTNLNSNYDILEKSLGETLLEPTKIYVKPVQSLLKEVEIKAICHITGGGFFENIPRILPNNLTATIYKQKIKTHNIFKLIMKIANISEKNMYEIFNMGIGMILVVSKEAETKTIKILEKNNFNGYRIGEVNQKDKKIELI